MNIENTCSIFIIFKIYQCAEILKKKCMHYENGIKDEKNIWKNLSLTWHNQGRIEGERSGRTHLLTLISQMSAGEDADKVTQLTDPEVLEAMMKKYGIE